MGFPGGTVVKNMPANAGDARDTGLTPGSGRSPRRRHGNPLQSSCLETFMDRGAWQATVHGIARVGHNLALSFFLSSILSWEIPWTEGPGGLQSMGSQSQTGVRDETKTEVLDLLFPLT